MNTRYSDQENRYLLLDNRNVPLAHVAAEGSTEGKLLTVRLLDNEAEGVLTHEIYRLLSIKKEQPPIQCQFVSQKNGRVVLEKISVLAPELRKDLRVPLHRQSFLYFPTEKGFGRYEIEFVDISCGGMAFYGPKGIRQTDGLEAALPLNFTPLIVKCQLLNERELRNEKSLYAAKFQDLCNDEEKAIREAVFSLQLEGRARSKQI